MLLPGPEAQQLAIYLGWLLHRTWGGVVAGVLFVLPGFLAILALSARLRDLRQCGAGRGPVLRTEGGGAGDRAAGGGADRLPGAAEPGDDRAIAAAAFVAIFFFAVPFPIIVFGAGLVGFVASRAGSELFRPGGGHGGKGTDGLSDADSALGSELPDARAGRRHAAGSARSLVSCSG